MKRKVSNFRRLASRHDWRRKERVGVSADTADWESAPHLQLQSIVNSLVSVLLAESARRDPVDSDLHLGCNGLTCP